MGKAIRLALAFTIMAAASAAHGADAANCAGFSAADAARFLGTSAGPVTLKVEKTAKALFTCTYSTGKSSLAIVFSVEAAPNAKKAAEDMERYRRSLVIASEVPPFKGTLPQGAYSDIMGLGDEAVWTDVNGVLTVRKAHFTIQVVTPDGKAQQLRLAKAVLAKP